MSAGDGASRTSAAEAERQVQRTRAEIALILDALEGKFAARRLIERGLDMWKESFNGYNGINRGVEAIRANPLPVALIGLGALWLVAGRLAQTEQADAARRRVGELAGSIVWRGNAGEEPLGHTGHPLIDDTDAERREGWIHQMADWASGAASSVRESAGTLSDRTASYARDGASRLGGHFRETVQRHPLAVGAVGIMTGALIAALLPPSRTEEGLIGGAREEFRRRVRETAARAVGAAAEAATDTVKSGLDKPSQA